MAEGATIGAGQVFDLLDALRRIGADASGLAASAGIGVVSPDVPSARVAAERVVDLLDRAAAALGDPLLGLHAGARAETRGPLYYLVLSTPRRADGLALLTQFARVAVSTQTIVILRHDALVELSLDPGDAQLRASRHFIDYTLAAILAGLRRAMPGLTAVRVELTHAEVGAPGETAAVFRCPVKFGCVRNALWLPEAVIKGSPAAANAAIAEQVRTYTAQLFREVTAGSMCGRVSDVVQAILLSGRAPQRSEVAKRLRTSQRTLQRQLEREGTSFTALRDRIRQEVACTLLANPALSVERIARSLGFADAAAFSKAFMRWFSCSPARYRAQRASAGAPSRRQSSVA
jgi:AraC-like DNA-binding protein